MRDMNQAGTLVQQIQVGRSIGGKDEYDEGE